MKEKKRAVRPMYVQADEPGNLPGRTIEGLVEKDRALALEAVLIHAPDLGMEKALKKFGDSLLPIEHKLLLTLSKDELKALKSIKIKLGNLLERGVSINIYSTG